LKTSISNLAWTHKNTTELIPKLKTIGVQGIEIAPTLIWPDFENIQFSEVSEFAHKMKGEGISISGIQSLSFGRPELQLFDSSTWGTFREHLKKMFQIGGELDASVAVFGSPKNRVKGDLDELEANRKAVDFFGSLIPDLIENNIRLTLEPNAIAYGADFLTNYNQVVHLSEEIGSPWIIPQIDTGCMWMSGDNVEESFSFHQPGHIHLSLPNLEIFPAEIDFKPFLNRIIHSDYSGWIVIEMLNKSSDQIESVVSATSKLHILIREVGNHG
jgi:D-psicose/D-tagatose/L-ribulose 3-epimerase